MYGELIFIIFEYGQLEIFLISELSRDSYEDAVRYVRSMKEDAIKLACFIRIAQALGQSNY